MFATGSTSAWCRCTSPCGPRPGLCTLPCPGTLRPGVMPTQSGSNYLLASFGLLKERPPDVMTGFRSQDSRRTFVAQGSGLTRGDRNRNRRVEALREAVRPDRDRGVTGFVLRAWLLALGIPIGSSGKSFGPAAGPCPHFHVAAPDPESPAAAQQRHFSPARPPVSPATRCSHTARRLAPWPGTRTLAPSPQRSSSAGSIPSRLSACSRNPSGSAPSYRTRAPSGYSSLKTARVIANDSPPLITASRSAITCSCARPRSTRAARPP